jgi:hypothetical protein
MKKDFFLNKIKGLRKVTIDNIKFLSQNQNHQHFINIDDNSDDRNFMHAKWYSKIKLIKHDTL